MDSHAVCEEVSKQGKRVHQRYYAACIGLSLPGVCLLVSYKTASCFTDSYLHKATVSQGRNKLQDPRDNTAREPPSEMGLPRNAAPR